MYQIGTWAGLKLIPGLKGPQLSHEYHLDQEFFYELSEKQKTSIFPGV